MGQSLRQMVDSGMLDHVDAASKPATRLEEGMTIDQATKHPAQETRDGVTYPTGGKFSNAPVRDKAKEMEVDAEDEEEDSGDDDEEDMSAGPVTQLAKNQRMKIQDIEDDTHKEDYSDDKPKLAKRGK